MTRALISNLAPLVILPAAASGGGTPPPSTYAAAVLATSPLAYYRLGESSGTTAADASGNGNDATYSNSPTLGATGLINGDSDTAVTFAPYAAPDATKAQCVLPAAVTSALNGSAWSMQAWVKYSTAGTANALTVGPKLATHGRLWGTNLGWGGSGLNIAFAEENVAIVANLSTILTAGTKYHIVWTYGSSTLKGYLNGVLKTSVSYTFGGSFAGQYVLGGGDPVTVDEVAVHNYALGGTDITTLYNAGA